MSYRSIFWGEEYGRLKTYSSTTKSDGTSVVKIEIEIRDPYRLAGILHDLGEIRREENAAKQDKPAAPKRAAARRAIANQPPLLLTHRRD